MSTRSAVLGPAPTALLRAILRPFPSAPRPTLVQAQLRTASKVSLLDKLHRKQRKAIRQERLDSIARAQAMPTPNASTSVPTNTSLASAPTSATTTSTAAPSADPAAAIPASQHASARPQSAARTPYTITRTPSRQLPIYHLSKAGGNKHLTKLRKIDGDLNRLKSDLRAALGVEDYVIDRKGRKKENVAINWTTKQIVVRGWRRPELAKWAEGMGF